MEAVRREASGSVCTPNLARVTWSKVGLGLSFGVLRGLKQKKRKRSLHSFRGKKKLGYLRWPVQVASQMRGICEHEPKALRSYEVICRIGQSHHGAPVHVKKAL